MNIEEKKEKFYLELLNYREQINLPLLEVFPKIKNSDNNLEGDKNISTKNDESVLYFKYKPLMPYSDYVKWRDVSFDGRLFRDLCIESTLSYDGLLKKCFYWYYENSLDESRFNLKVQLAEYESMIHKNISSCPILEQIDARLFDINFLRRVKNIMNFAKKHNIKGYHRLVKERIDDPAFEEIHELRRLLQNSINCIVYKDFEGFLKEQLQLQEAKENQKPNVGQQKNQNPTETKTEHEKPKKLIANEYALAYIFDLMASGKQIPVNRKDGGYDKKALIKIGSELYQFNEEKDTFYRAVKHVATFELNKRKDLEQISKCWIEAVKAASKDWGKTHKYLIEKGLIGE